MSQRKPLMPKATAVWLVDNTALTFDQIAHFCGLHVLEVKGIADGDVAHGIKGLDPISSGQITREEIRKGEADPAHDLKIAEPKVSVPQVTTRKKGPRYTPVSRRQDRPNAVLWLLRNHPELKDAQVIRLVGTTKPTIAQIRDRSHWNSANLQPQDPVTLGLCSQIELDAEVKKAAERAEKERKEAGIELEPAGSLLPTAETTEYRLDGLPEGTAPGDGELGSTSETSAASDAAEEAAMFERLQSMSSEEAATEDEPVQSAEDVFRRPAEPAVEAEAAEEPGEMAAEGADDALSGADEPTAPQSDAEDESDTDGDTAPVDTGTDEDNGADEQADTESEGDTPPEPSDETGNDTVS